MNSFFELLMLRDAARIFIRNVSSVFIGCLMPNQRLVCIFIPSFAIWRHWCYLCDFEESHAGFPSVKNGLLQRLQLQQRWKKDEATELFSVSFWWEISSNLERESETIELGTKQKFEVVLSAFWATLLCHSPESFRVSGHTKAEKGIIEARCYSNDLWLRRQVDETEKRSLWTEARGIEEISV